MSHGLTVGDGVTETVATGVGVWVGVVAAVGVGAVVGVGVGAGVAVGVALALEHATTMTATRGISRILFVRRVIWHPRFETAIWMDRLGY
jgi:hypothetical protein